MDIYIPVLQLEGDGLLGENPDHSTVYKQIRVRFQPPVFRALWLSVIELRGGYLFAAWSSSFDIQKGPIHRNHLH